MRYLSNDDTSAWLNETNDVVNNVHSYSGMKCATTQFIVRQYWIKLVVNFQVFVFSILI